MLETVFIFSGLKVQGDGHDYEKGSVKELFAERKYDWDVNLVRWLVR